MTKPFTKLSSPLHSGDGVEILYRVDGFHNRSMVCVSQAASNGKFQAPAIEIVSVLDTGSGKATANLAAALRDAVRESRRLDKRTGKKVKP